MTPNSKATPEPAPAEQAINRVFINNRGEIGLRILQACHKLGIGAVLACADQDLDSLAARTALEYSLLDDRYAIAPLRGRTSHQSYENLPVVMASAKAYGCDALHPGYGFMAEKYKAARALGEIGVRFIGPKPEVLEMVGNKTTARELAKRCRVPLLPGSDILTGTDMLQQEAKRIGFPIMLKAEDAGGGAGNRVVHDMAEAKNIFTNLAPRFINLYLERYVAHARHIEIQIAGDKHGNVVALGERDCSPQRRFQKVIEESPALIVPARIKEKMIEQSIRMAKKAGYHGLATFEYLYDPTTLKHYFMEINPRIQVEHPVTEERYGVDLIELQLLIEQGKRLPSIPPARANNVIEARLYAEKTQQGFLPDAGAIRILNIPDIKGVRVDRAYEEGDSVPAGFDTTIAKLIATGKTREEAREKLAEMLAKITASGVSTNREFLLWLIDTEEFRANTVSTTFIEEAWGKHQRERFRGAEGFLSGGEFFPERQPVRFAPEMFPQNLTYERNGRARNYADDIRKLQAENPDSSAFKYGIYQDTSSGIRLCFGFWDFKMMGGTLGAEEGSAVASLFEMAHKKGLPVVMVTSSGGARQQENSLALQQMDYMMAAARKYPPKLFVNVYSGPNFGGVTASIAGSPDIQMAVDGSLIGLTGPDSVAKIMGKQDRGGLPVGSHSAHDHYRDRNIDMIVGDLEEARVRILAICSELGLTESRLPYEFNVRAFDSLTPGTRYDRPSEHRFAARISGLTSTIFRHPEKKTKDERLSQDLTPAERMSLIYHPLRPTTADLLNPALKLFESMSALSNKIIVDNIEQYPSIIGGIAQLGGEPVMVLGQQTLRHQTLSGELRKEYKVPQGPSDLRWARRKIDFAEQRGLPIIHFGDTMGADAKLEAERYGITAEIAEYLERLHEVRVPVMSINLGHNGSGGGLTFIRPLDASADLSNALTLVSTIDVQTWILTGDWPKDDEARNRILNQLEDAKAESRLRNKQIDDIIEEPPGGAQNDWGLIAKRLRSFLIRQMSLLSEIPANELLDRRYERSKEAAQFATRPNTLN